MLNRKWCLEWRNHKVWKTNYHLFDITWSSWLGGGMWGVVGGLGGQYTWVFRRSECKWVKISQRKRSQNLHGMPKYGAPSKFFLNPMFQGVYSDQRNTAGHAWTPRKRLKKGERVLIGHFHERVGESPRSDENLAPVELRFLVLFPRYGCLNLELVIDQISLSRIWALLKGYDK